MSTNPLLQNEIKQGGENEQLPTYEKPNRQRAQEFFNLSLPRRIYDPTQKTGHRLAKPGETSDQDGHKSTLYPLLANDEALSEFGIGVALYFYTVKVLVLILFVCSLFSIIAMKSNYEFNPDNTILQLQGSVFGATRENLKLNEQGVSDIICCILFCTFAVISGFYEKKIVTKFDISQQTTQDYSVVCTNPPITCLDLQVYYDFFSKFGEVVLVSLAITNGELLQSLAQRKVIENKLQGLIAEADAELGVSAAPGTRKDNSVDNDNDRLIDSKKYENMKLTFLQRIGLAPTIQSCFQDLRRVTIDINVLCGESEKFTPWQVYVTFNNEVSQKNCLLKTNVGKFSVFMNSVTDNDVLLFGKTLDIIEAREPNDVIYEHSHRSFLYRFCTWIISYLCCGVLLIGTFFIIRALSGNGDITVAVFISIINAMLPAIIKIMTKLFEVHIAERDVQKSMLLKLVIGRCINSAILIYAATKFEETFSEGSLLQMQNILIADAVTTPVLRLVNWYDLIMRYLVTPLVAKTQEDYNAAWMGADWNLAERYTDMLKTIFVGLFFLVPLPSGLFISTFAMIVTYVVDKYSLFRLWKRCPSLDHSLGTISRYFCVGIVFTHVSISRVYFANWPYADSSEEATCGFFVCATDGDDNMTSDQKDIVDAYSGANVAMFVVVILWGIIYKLYRGIQQFYHGKVNSVGEASAIPFTSVPNLEAYCPNVKREEFYSPILCADVSDVPKQYLPLRGATGDHDVDSQAMCVYSLQEFPSDKISNKDQLEKLFGKIKCYNKTASYLGSRSLFVSSASPLDKSTDSFEVLPTGWEKKCSPDGKIYYVDHNTQTSHWTLPSPNLTNQMSSLKSQQQTQQTPYQNKQSEYLPQNYSQQTSVQRYGGMSAAMSPVLPFGWEQKRTPGGRVYYVDHNTRQTYWERPL